MAIKEDDELMRKLPYNIDELREDSICGYPRLILQSGLRKIYAHRLPLTRLSDYFTVLFRYEGSFEKPTIEFDENISCLD
jgi:hypothetical protein